MSVVVGARLTTELVRWAAYIENVARGRGLDFFEVVFEMLDARDVNAIAAYGGFPVRYPSWRFGMDFERLEKGRQYGLARIYELVINNDPTYAYLVRTNSLMEQKLVMAHVFGHADFFKHNVWFQPTDRRMLETMAAHSFALRGHIDRFGQDTVERFLDLSLSLDSLCDPYLALREHLRRKPVGQDPTLRLASLEDVCRASRSSSSARAPTYDVLGFLAERAPLEPWQSECLRIVRNESVYFLPQRMTKIMNEGWASLWHSRILTGGVLDVSEIVEFADCHSGATAAAPGQFNPYKLGIELYRTAEERGIDIFRLRRIHGDASLIDALVDEEFATRNSLFLFGKNERTGRTEVVDRDWRTVKQRLLAELAWGGLPEIELVDEDHEGRGELLLRHHHDGRDLEIAHAAETLHNVARVWKKPVHLLTVEEGVGRLLTSDGTVLRTAETPAHASGSPSCRVGQSGSEAR